MEQGSREKVVLVRVSTGARKESISEEKEGEFMISVKEEASGNRANLRVRELLAEYFNKSVSSVKIESGHHFSKKRVRISLLGA